MTWILPLAVAASGGALLQAPLAALAGAAVGTGLGRLLSGTGRTRRLAFLLCAALVMATVRRALPTVRTALLALAAGQGASPLAVAFLAAVTSACLAVWMLRGRLGFGAVTMALVPAFGAAEQIRQVNSAWFAVYLLSGMLILLPAPLRLSRPRAARHLLRGTWLPCCLAVAAVLCLPELVPGQSLRRELLAVGEKGIMGILGVEADMGFLQRTATVPLGKAPPAGGNVPLLEITPREGGVYYLRGQDYDIFTGLSWESDETRTEEFGGWGKPVDRVSIRVLGYGNYMLLPYYPGEGTTLRGGHVGLTLGDYSVDIYPEGSAMAPHRLGTYYRLDDDTRAWGAAFLQGASTPGAIARLVSGSAVYDRAAPAMPEEEENFAVWFAERSDRGYCTHFATLAVVLLRCAGIPARYVTGFRVEAPAGEVTSVTADCAHAWAEFYDFSSGVWKILECTPAAEAGVAITGETGSRSLAIILNICKWLSISVFFVVYFQSKLRLLLRRCRFRRGTVRQRAWYLYDEAVFLSRLLGESPPEYLQDRLQRALYSRAGMEERELESFRVYCRQCLRRLRRRKLFTRLHHRLHYAAY